MAERPTYRELEQRTRDLEAEIVRLRQEGQELYEAQERCGLYFSLANDVMYSIDPQFRITSISPNVEKMLGYRPEELVGQPFHELNVLAPEYAEPALSDVVSILSGEVFDTTVYQFVAKDGRRLFGEVYGVPMVRNGKAVAVVSMARDITSRLEMEQSLRESEERFRAVFDSAQDCIFIKNRDLVYTFVNPVMKKDFGLSSPDVIGKKDSDLYGADMSGHLAKIDRKVLDGEVMEEEHVRQVNRTQKIFHVIKVPMRDNKGTVNGLCGIARNITERKQFEKALCDKERELEFQARNLSEMNTALKVLLDSRDDEKRKAQEDIVAKTRKLILPYLEKMEHGSAGDGSQAYLKVLRLNLEELISSYVNGDSHHYRVLTTTEIQVADLVRQGKTTKEIASIMNVSLPAVSFHRANVRKKLGLLHSKTNLRAYLQGPV